MISNIIPRKYPNQIIDLAVRTYRPERMVCIVHNANRAKQHTDYFAIAPIIKGTDKIQINIPKFPSEGVVIELYNEANGHRVDDQSFSVSNPIDGIRPLILPEWNLQGVMSSTVRDFADFSDTFAERAGYTSVGQYKSPSGKFQINYLYVIRDDDGRELKTPARINSETGLIEVAQKYYLTYTVPGRKALQWHEFSHVFVNNKYTNLAQAELDADKNAIMIYLGMGNPKVEAINVFLNVFRNSTDRNGQPSDINRKRADELYRLIKEVSGMVNSNQLQRA